MTARRSLAAVVVAAGALALGGVVLHATAQPSTQPAGANAAAGASTQPAGRRETTPSGLTIIYTAPGSGAQNGDRIGVHYTGRLQDGTVFDSSHKRGEPIQITLGAGQVIKGWDEGIVGMQVGEKRTLIIPPNLAYGSESRGEVIPANATLTFDIELVSLRRMQ